MQNDISFIVVNYFTSQLIENLIHSIFQNNDNINLEVIVVDNTTEESARFRLTQENIKIYSNSENIGFGRACNIGAKLASSENLVFINPDSLFCDRDSMPKLAESFNSFPKNTVFGGSILDQNKRPVCNTFRFSKFIHIYFQNTFRRVLGISLPLLTNKDNAYEQDRYIEVDWISGAFLCINKDFFQRLGGFDEAIFMYEEDAELCHRAKQFNGKIIFTPAIKIIHYGGAASRDNNELLSFIGLKSALYFYEKRNARLKTILLKKMIFITWNTIYFKFIHLSLLAPSFFATRKLFWKKLINISKRYDNTSVKEMVKWL